MTNFEKIKQMTVEEFAELLNDITSLCSYNKCDRAKGECEVVEDD